MSCVGVYAGVCGCAGVCAGCARVCAGRIIRIPTGD